MVLVASYEWHCSTLAKLRKVPVICTKIIAFLLVEQLNSSSLLIVSDSKVTILLLTDSTYTSRLEWVKHLMVPIV